MDEQRKNIDESWKEQAIKEKQAVNSEKEFVAPEPDFSFFITTLSLQAAISLGQIPNPTTNKKDLDLKQAKFLIDTLDMLRDKTKGNLTAEESGLIENIVYELKMQYISQNKGA